MTAMTAMSLAELSGGRFIVGLEPGTTSCRGLAWRTYGKPVTRLKEYVQIMKQIFRREAPLSFEGELYQLPYTGAGATGLGKPLKYFALRRRYSNFLSQHHAQGCGRGGRGLR